MKAFYRSKTFWVNMIAIAGMISQSVWGVVLLDFVDQATILAVVNLILRAVTDEGIGLRDEPKT